ncbi:Transglutaminase-like enzyme, putative cysteine protease [Reichenbachiella agariperforans]|uniref:Transglutaminase-like enzyme, putative cysteine protease n=1 Tax=Reichenbachiella agariperforans TaxID=156994 RepID=A0A1M6LL72_REIAG|nr:transglutaminase family protein [Reichenbachiella agariperforans]SHJ71934.1 Transglutaminase-like enzyme, putative cysteine protease [Reichenbachiella agariperforans]
MSIYQVSYQTTNSYEHLVKEALFSLLVLPVADDCQSFVSYSVDCNLQRQHYLQPNLYGFDQLMFRVDHSFDQLSIIVNSTVEVAEINPFDFEKQSLTDENAMMESLDFKVTYQPFLFQSQSTRINLSRLSPEMTKSVSVKCVDFLQFLNAYIYKNFKFDDDVNSLLNTPKSTWEKKQGVCQDFAQFFIAVCRANNIPARYVSGYLNQGEGHIGSAMLHAWVEVFIPGLGWQGYDPTNNLLRDSHYIKVCHGVDYEDCSPIKGILNTQGDNFTEYKVEVTQQ